MAYLLRLYCCDEDDFAGGLDQYEELVTWQRIADARSAGNGQWADSRAIHLESIFSTALMDLLGKELIHEPNNSIDGSVVLAS